MDLEKYTYEVFWSDEDQAHVARAIEWPHMSGIGGTPEEALRELFTAIEGAIEMLAERGEEVPEPLGATR